MIFIVKGNVSNVVERASDIGMVRWEGRGGARKKYLINQ